jgi:hypothetical protein
LDREYAVTARRIRIEDEEVTITLDTKGGCACIEDRIHFISADGGARERVLMEGPAARVRRWEFEILEGGQLGFSEDGRRMRVIASWQPLSPGEEHQLVYREYPPPDDVDTFTVERGPTVQRFGRLVCRLWIPPSQESKLAIWAIKAWPPDLINIFYEFCERRTPTTNGLVVYEWRDLDIGFNYGLFWEPVELADRGEQMML